MIKEACQVVMWLFAALYIVEVFVAATEGRFAAAYTYMVIVVVLLLVSVPFWDWCWVALDRFLSAISGIKPEP